MRFPHNTKIFRGQLDIAPVASVFFLLLMFLLFNSTLVFTPGVRIHLPEAVGLPGTANPTLAVAVDESGQCYFENQIINEERLKEKLQAAVANSPEPLTLVLMVDRNAKSGVVVRLELLAGSVGIREVLHATRPLLTPMTAPAPR